MDRQAACYHQPILRIDIKKSSELLEVDIQVVRTACGRCRSNRKVSATPAIVSAKRTAQASGDQTQPGSAISYCISGCTQTATRFISSVPVSCGRGQSGFESIESCSSPAVDVPVQFMLRHDAAAVRVVGDQPVFQRRQCIGQPA